MSKHAIVAIAFAAAASMAAADINKGPDVGDYWFPLNAETGTWVYADSFVAGEDDLSVTRLGTWLNSQFTDGPSIRFEVWGDTEGAGPDASNVIATTGSIPGINNEALTYYEFAVLSPASLTPGQTYWFCATVVGETGSGYYNVGGHTQNSVYQDNGTFWYSNDPAGVFFDGQALTPEMAFQVITEEDEGCAADFNGDGNLNLFDFLSFQTAFGNGDPEADFNGDGNLNLFDFLSFQTAFGNGC